MSSVLAGICAAIWAYLMVGRGQFWRARLRDSAPAPQQPRQWPAVVAVVPARNEAECIGASIDSLLQQDYPGSLAIIVVDDDSTDATAASVRAKAEHAGRALHVLSSKGPPAGWTGKLWALEQGIAAVEPQQADYILLTDADIVHAPDTLASLVARAKSGQLVLTSLMAKLRCDSFAERSHVPAFIYFFQMLFPFSWVSRSDCRTAAAAGGCMLVQAAALKRRGGLGAIRNALIDDCALAASLKTAGPIWLGLTERSRSIRPYPALTDVAAMISRSAYAQLRYSPLLLVGTIAGLALTFFAPPLLAIFARGWPQYLGIATWLAMAVSFLPTLRFYRRSPLWAPALPAIAALYAGYTLDSAYRHVRRRGGNWKGRVHTGAPSLS